VGRAERQRELARLLHERFGDVGIGSADPEPQPVASDAYGNYFMPALFGCAVSYPRDQAPGNAPLRVDMEEMARLRVPDLQGSPVVRRAFAEARRLRERYGFCSGAVNTGSPLNVAVNVFGEQFLMACKLEPETARHVLRVIAATELRLYREFSAVVDPEHFPPGRIAFGYGNCPAVMLSPATYRDVVLPVDLWVRQQVSELHLHHCGVLDDYIELYRDLRPSSLDIGGESDYAAVRRAFPDIPFSLIVNAPDIEGRSAGEVDHLIGSAVEGAGPPELISFLWVAEVSEAIDDETVRAVRTALERV